MRKGDQDGGDAGLKNNDLMFRDRKEGSGEIEKKGEVLVQGEGVGGGGYFSLRTILCP
jgi:hypothetical protein